MLKRAILFRPQLASLFVEASDKFENRFYCDKYWEYERVLEVNDWAKHQFVSVDKFDNVIGFFEADINRAAFYITNISLIRFKKEKDFDYSFSKDIRDFFYKLMLDYEYRKIEYTVAIGSPNEKWYDRFTERYGGRIVGFLKDHFVLENGCIYDLKIYEIFRKDFMNNLCNLHQKTYNEYMEYREKYGSKKVFCE